MVSEAHGKDLPKIEALREQEQKLVSDHIPKFERGIAEAAIEREWGIWKDLEPVFLKHKISPEVGVRLDSDTQPGPSSHPVVVCGGVVVTLTYRVFPVDACGLDGSMPADVLEQIASIRQKIQDLRGG